MAEVKLYIFKGTEKGEGISLTKSGDYSFDKSTILPPKTEKDETKGLTTLISTTITNSYALSVSLLKLEYCKKIYKPCDIFAKIQTSGIQMKTTKVTKTSIIDQNGKELESKEETDEGDFKIDNEKTPILVQLFKGAKVVLEIDGHTVAENYFVFNVRTICNTNSTSIVLRLSISSADKLMDLDKYSRAYTAKRLYTDILSEESKQFKNVEVANHMQLMKYKDSEETTSRDELRIPYLVQYNETFYQFMARNANRFGEFLYFEEGKLNLGMQPSELNYYKKDKDKEVVIDWATEPNAVQRRYYDSALSEGIVVKDCSYNYVDHTQKNDDNQLYAESASSRYNFDPVAVDEWTKQELKSGEYLDYNEILGEEMKASVPEAIFKALGASTLSEVLVNLVKGFIMKLIDVSRQNRDYNNVLDDANFQDGDDNYLISDDQRDDDVYTQFASLGGSSPLESNLSKLLEKSGIKNFYDLFYSLIRKKEKEIGEQALWLDFGNYYKPINLGDKLHVAGQDYVAISINGSYEIEEKEEGKTIKEDLLVSAVPVMTLTNTYVTTETTTDIGEDVWTSTFPLPPALPDVVIRDARPQVAFVAETLDPQNLGRIRVRYPWQDKNGDASPWIRVTLPLATDGGGVNFTPNVGDEVMVGYVNGNIDHPYAIGYLAAPFVNKRWSNALPLDQYGGMHGIKTKTGHHLTFQDGFALAPMFFESVGCLSFLKSIWPIGATGPWPLSYDLTSDFGGGFELADRYGFYKISGSTEERAITIESPIGTVEMSAFQGITISAPNGDVKIEGKNVTISANNSLQITSGETIKDRFYYKNKFDQNKGLAYGASVLMDLKNLAEYTFDKLIDVSFLRTVLEVLLRPVDGTLQIKSYTFIQMEAGSGVTEIPDASFRSAQSPVPQDDVLLTKILINVSYLKDIVDSLVKTIMAAYNNLIPAVTAFNVISDVNGINQNGSVVSFTDVVSYGCNPGTKKLGQNDDNIFHWGNAGLDLETIENYNPNGIAPTEEDALLKWNLEKQKYDRNVEKNKKRELIVSVSETLRKRAKELSMEAKKWKEMDGNDLKPSPPGDVEKNIIIPMIKNLNFFGNVIISLDDMKTGNYQNTIGIIHEDIWKAQITGISRYVVYLYIREKVNGNVDFTADGNLANLADAADNKKWRAFVESIKKGDSGIGMQFISFLKNGLNNKILTPIKDEFTENFKKWKNGYEGKILFSESKSKTISFGDGQNQLNASYNQSFGESLMSSLFDELIKM